MTRLFAPCDGARVFGLPPGADFLRSLVAGLDARLEGQPPDAAARVTIWVNTRRAQRSLREAFAAGPARLLPRIRVIGDLATDPLMAAGLAPGGHAIIATFADDGPERCSGLPVARYAPGDLAGELDRLAPGLLAPVRALRHDHETPGGAVQRFQTSVFRRIG